MDGGIFAEYPYDVACPSGVGSSHDRKHPQPLPSVIPTINLAHFECGADDGSCLSDLATRPRVATARYDEFFAHLGQLIRLHP
jgi:hypothetical protein